MTRAETAKIAIFVAASIPDVPEGCPSNYVLVNFKNRKSFAKWLQENGKQYLLKEAAGSSLYHYQKGRYDFFVGIVPVDLTRPWMIGIYADKERICYLDRIDDSNQVIPDVQPFKGCAGFGFDSCVER